MYRRGWLDDFAMDLRFTGGTLALGIELRP
jgi:hypothetical protein